MFLTIAFVLTKICNLLNMDKYGESYYWLLESIYRIADERKKLKVIKVLFLDLYTGAKLKKNLLRLLSQKLKTHVQFAFKRV